MLDVCAHPALGIHPASHAAGGCRPAHLLSEFWILGGYGPVGACPPDAWWCDDGPPGWRILGFDGFGLCSSVRLDLCDDGPTYADEPEDDGDPGVGAHPSTGLLSDADADRELDRITADLLRADLAAERADPLERLDGEGYRDPRPWSRREW